MLISIYIVVFPLLIFLALYNPVTRFMVRTGFKNRNLLIKYLQDVINLSSLSINIELYAIDIENNRIMNCQEYLKNIDR